MRSHVKYLCIFFALFLFSWEIQAFALYFQNHFFFFENADLKSYQQDLFERNQSSSAENSDDAFSVAYSEIRFITDLEYKKSIFHIDISRWGYWGSDNFQGGDAGQNSLLFNRLYFLYSPSPSFTLTLGRHKHEIGNSYWDYFFSDVLDGASIAYSWEKTFTVQLTADVPSNSIATEELGIYGITKKDEESIEDFRGDTLSARMGLNLHLQMPEGYKLFFDDWGWRAFSYYLRYGANNLGGADLAEDGKNSYNKADNDFLSTSGLRLYGKLAGDALEFDFTWAYSKGIDFQFEEEHPYDGYGTALNLVWKAKNEDSFRNDLWLSSGYFHPDFAGMKGRSMGGMLLWGYKRYYASPYASSYHFRDAAKEKERPTQIDKTNSKIFVKLKEKLQVGGFKSSLSFLSLWETQSGEYMGTEIELELEYRIENIKFSHTSALYLPSRYYEKRAFQNSFIPSGKNSFYGFRFSVEYVLDLNFVSTKKRTELPGDQTKKLLDIEKESRD